MPINPYEAPKGDEKPPIGFWKKAELLLSFVCAVASIAIVTWVLFDARRESIKSRERDEQRAIQRKASVIQPKE
jgi:hypothetical protein